MIIKNEKNKPTNITIKLYVKRMFPSLVFNEINLEIPGFGLKTECQNVRKKAERESIFF